MLLDTLKRLQLVTGRGAVKDLRRACHAGRLAGGLSIALRATPDEVVGPLTHSLGGGATRLKVLDVRTSVPMVLEVQWRDLAEKWEVEDVRALIHNLNDLFRHEPDVRAALVLGDWEDMVQVWCVPKPTLSALAAARVLDEADNAATFRRWLEEEPAMSRS